MTARVAIIADDLTGALDSSAAFAEAGLSVAVAVTPAGLERARALRPEVLVVNTASRAMPAGAAAAAVRGVALRLAAERPAVVLKKIDSRLKGNVGVEAAALAEALGLARLVVAPAAPDQGRVTRDGAVTGAGVAAPLAIAPYFQGAGLPVEIADAATDADLDGVVARAGADALLVGTRGIGAALARRLGHGLAPLTYEVDPATLFAFGSRDAITAAQIEALLRERPDIAIAELPQGELAGALPRALPALLRCGGETAAEPGVVAARLGKAIVRAMEEMRPTTLVVGGGDTALALLDMLGIEVVVPTGEAEPGVVVFGMASGVRCLVKSGGFGSVDVLVRLMGAARQRRGPAGKVARG